MALILPNVILNDTPADAIEVEQNYTVTESYINANLVHRDGSVSMQAPLRLFGDPIGEDDAVRKGYVDSILPVGVIMLYGGVVAPAGAWALCNGASMQTSLYPKLFNVYQYRFGGSGGSFLLPKVDGRVVVGLDTTQTRFDTTGDKGGTWEVPVPQHRHDMDHNHDPFTTAQGGSHTHTMQSNGAHNHTLNARNEGGNAPQVAHSLGSGTIDTVSTSGVSDHTHTINADTHTHTIDIPTTSGLFTANTGTADAEHLPPYVVLAYICRVA